MSSLPSFSMQELIEAGVHYGHKTQRWDPRMAPYLFGIRHDIHIIDLQQTMPLLQRALAAVRDIVSRNGRVLFVGTKRQAQQVIADEAKRCGQYYVNHRWLGGMLTNWKTVSQSLRHLRKLDEQLAQTNLRLKKKEILQLQRKKGKLERALGGIKEMAGLPNIIVVIDTNKEALAIDEAKRLGIPVIAILDSNSNPEGIAYPIPGNDDALRAIKLYCRLFSNAVLAGIQEEISKSGVDIGAAEDLSAVEAADAADAAAKAGATKSAKGAAKAKSSTRAKKAVKDSAKTDAAEANAETEAEGSIAPDNDAEADGADTAEGKEETATKKAS